MKNLIALGFAIGLGFCVGCSTQGTDASKATGPAPTQEQQEADLQKAMDSGAIDPATYGKQ